MDKDDYVQLIFKGRNSGPIQFKGYLNRTYRVKRGDKPLVHKHDVQRLLGSGKFRLPEPETTPKPPSKPVTIDPENGISDEEATAAGKALAQRREETQEAPKISKSAQKILDEAGIDAATVQGTGKDGLITVKDAREAAKQS